MSAESSFRPAEALILVDVQRSFLIGPAAVPGAAGLTERLSELLDRARSTGALVVHLQNDGQPGQPDQPGTPGWRLALDHQPGNNEVILRKRADDAFTETPLADLLAVNGANRLVLAGLLSEMCVSATARGALARGLQVVLPRDAHGTYDLGDISAATVARVTEHALGDEVDLPASVNLVTFTA